MVIIAFLWSLIGSACVALGLESPEAWKKVFKGSFNTAIPKAMLIFGAILSVIDIVGSFYFFVTGNALIILAAWILLFVVLRFIVEILLRPNIYGDEKRSHPHGRSKKDVEKHIHAEHVFRQAGSPEKRVSEAAHSEIEVPGATDEQASILGTDDDNSSYAKIFNRINSGSGSSEKGQRQ